MAGWADGPTPLAAGRRASRRQARLCGQGRHGIARDNVKRACCPELRRSGGEDAVHRARAPQKEADIHWAQARAGGGDRVRRFDRLRSGPSGRLQRPARGQAGRRGDGRQPAPVATRRSAGRRRARRRRAPGRRGNVVLGVTISTPTRRSGRTPATGAGHQARPRPLP